MAVPAHAVFHRHGSDGLSAARAASRFRVRIPNKLPNTNPAPTAGKVSAKTAMNACISQRSVR